MIQKCFNVDPTFLPCARNAETQKRRNASATTTDTRNWVAFDESILIQKCFNVDPTFLPCAQKRKTQLLNRIKAIMPQAVIYYEPKLLLYHLVRSQKMTWRWIIPAYFAQGRDFYFVCPPPTSKLRWLGRVLKYSALFLLSLPFDLLFRNRTQYPYIQNFLLEVTCDYLAALGELYEQSRQLIQRSG